MNTYDFIVSLAAVIVVGLWGLVFMLAIASKDIIRIIHALRGKD